MKADESTYFQPEKTDSTLKLIGLADRIFDATLFNWEMRSRYICFFYNDVHS